MSNLQHSHYRCHVFSAIHSVHSSQNFQLPNRVQMPGPHPSAFFLRGTSQRLLRRICCFFIFCNLILERIRLLPILRVRFRLQTVKKTTFKGDYIRCYGLIYNFLNTPIITCNFIKNIDLISDIFVGFDILYIYFY